MYWSAATGAGDLPQELEAVTLFLKRISLGVGSAQDFQRLGRQLDTLPFARTLGRQLAGNAEHWHRS